jgi:hypothetical protein
LIEGQDRRNARRRNPDSSEFSKAIDALAERGIRAEIHRQESGRLVPDVVGEVVDGWGDEEGPWVTVMPELRALTSTGTAES